MSKAFTFYKGASIATESSYPYTAKDGTCTSSYTTAIPQGAVTGYVAIESKNENALLDAVSNVGPVSVGVDALSDYFAHYSSGVLTKDLWCGHLLDHAVLVVGFGSLDGTDFWKVKNSWGTTYGADGYILIERGADQCGIAEDASYPVITGDVPPTPAPAPTSPAPTPAPTPAPAPTPPPAPAPVEGRCIAQKDEVTCLHTLQNGGICSWCPYYGTHCQNPGTACASGPSITV